MRAGIHYTNCVFASPSETASIKVTDVYIGNLNKMNSAYRSQVQLALQMGQETYILMRTTKQARELQYSAIYMLLA